MTKLDNDGQEASREDVLDFLIARDEVYAALTEGTRNSTNFWKLLGVEHLSKIKQLDEELKKKDELITKKLNNLTDWHNILNPPKEAWWWFPEHPWDKLDWLWRTLSILCITIAIGLLTETSSRFLSGGPDTRGAITVAIQSTLTLLGAGGILTQAGRQAIKDIFSSLNIPAYWEEEARFFLALLLCLSFAFINYSLPWVANYYNNLGLSDYNTGLLSSAQKKFNRAILLNPNNMHAHYNLGRLCEALQDFDHARTEYQTAVQGGLSEAYNELAHLYIQEKKNSSAVSLLLAGLNIVARDKIVYVELKYALLKNLGWAQLKQENYEDAESSLRDAIELNSEYASAHCLLAQVLEDQGNKKTLVEWEECLRFASSINPDESAWIISARHRLKGQGEK
ncbi:MAG: tetratricopeptide repeat protein [Microcystaceae cyanobacterium]